MSSAGDSSDSNLPTRAPSGVPEVWHELVSSRDPALIECLSAAVQRRTGQRPAPATVVGFLSGLVEPFHLEVDRTSESHPGVRGPSIYPSPRKRVEE